MKFFCIVPTPLSFSPTKSFSFDTLSMTSPQPNTEIMAPTTEIADDIRAEGQCDAQDLEWDLLKKMESFYKYYHAIVKLLDDNVDPIGLVVRYIRIWGDLHPVLVELYNDWLKSQGKPAFVNPERPIGWDRPIMTPEAPEPSNNPPLLSSFITITHRHHRHHHHHHSM